MHGIDWGEIQKSLGEAALQVSEHARIQAKKNHTSIYLEDAFGRIIKEYPDGRRTQVIRDTKGEREIPLIKSFFVCKFAPR